MKYQSASSENYIFSLSCEYILQCLSNSKAYSLASFSYFILTLNSFQSQILLARIFHAVNDTAQPKYQPVKLTAPVFAECHICDKLRFNVVVVIISKLFVSLAVKVEIKLFFVMVVELCDEELIHKVFVLFRCQLFFSADISFLS